MDCRDVPHVSSGCGVFGILRKERAPQIPVERALDAIECVRYRGSRYGAGFASVSLRANTNNRIKVFVDGHETLEEFRNSLVEKLHGRVKFLGAEYRTHSKTYDSYVFETDVDTRLLGRVAQLLNSEFAEGGNIRARIYSWGRYAEVFKGIGYPTDVFELYNLGSTAKHADLWLSHTRQPTNSPGRLPIWSHPFSSGEWVIVHNGDISSFGANMEFLNSVGYRSFVGTDSEVIAYLLDYLTSTEGMNIENAAQILCNSFEQSINDGELLRQMTRLRGARLDGPFTVVAGYCDGYDVYLLALTDRFKFRPIVVGEDEGFFYVASEEAEIRTASRDAKVWTIEPGGYFLASMRRGLIHPGRAYYERFARGPITSRPSSGRNVIDASGMSYSQINKAIRSLAEQGFDEIHVTNVNGQRYIGAGIDASLRLKIYGTPGNCLANFNQSLEIEVYGSAQDDVGDAMHGGSVVIHGAARDVLGQALQGGYIYVAGDVGNRCGIQMREYMHKRPYIIVGGRADDYLGEYMAGGVIVVLGLNYLDTDEQIVGRCVATGMVGGRIYIRGRVDEARIGLQPARRDVERYLEGLFVDGVINEEVLKELRSQRTISLKEVMSALPPDAAKQLYKLYEHKYFSPLSIEYRRLGDDDLKILSEHLTRFAAIFGKEHLIEQALSDEFTIIQSLRKRGIELQGEEG